MSAKVYETGELDNSSDLILQPLGEETPLAREVRVVVHMPGTAHTSLALFSLENKK